MLKKIKSKKGISSVITMLIIVVIAGAVTYFVSSSLGKSAKTASSSAETQVTTSINKSASFASGSYGD